MKFSGNATTEIVFGDGSFDREIVRNVLEKNEDKYCELLLFIPESGAKGKSLPIGTGLECT
ncbi:hypothetical protein [Saccharolobus shibatae]|uniref:Uncharacterized protein n=1 Tax=Saccharolobus shibatae TaxID=2286 RepID=A0A8F5GZU3_9CREN|nr:hypothetical protein [Saccharolobus shibatae]QXJ34922.1 hypothetical protein J5U22_01469 [Saccharolobus shibatae]